MTCETRAQTEEESKIADFAAGLLEYFIQKAGTAKLGYRVVFGEHLVSIGPKKFRGSTQAEAFEKVIHWVLVKKLDYTPEQLQQAIQEVAKTDAQAGNDYLDKLAEGGMSEFGKRIQAAREEYGDRIHKALTYIDTEGFKPLKMKTPEEILEEVRQLVNDEVEMSDVLVALGDYHHLRETSNEPHRRSQPGSA